MTTSELAIAAWWQCCLAKCEHLFDFSPLCCCLAKCVHVIKTGCRPLSLSLSCVLAHLYSRTDQQPSRNKKLHRSKNRANPAFNAWALVGPPTAGLASHWPTPSCDSGPNRPFCQLPSFSANYSSRERRGSVSLRRAEAIGLVTRREWVRKKSKWPRFPGKSLLNNG